MPEGADGDPEEEQRAVVASRAVETQFATPEATVNEDPLPVASDRHGDRFHRRATPGSAIPRGIVEMPAPEAVGAMVPVRSSRRVEWDIEVAVAAAERGTGVVARP